MTAKTAEKYGGLDIVRLAAAFLVVAIHTSPLEAVSPAADFFLTRILARLAVPFFFMVTGQFVLGEYYESKKGRRNKGPEKENLRTGRNLGRAVKKLGILYVFSIVLYLPLGIYAGHYQGIGALEAVRLLLFDGTFYHLWYFPACILGLCLTGALCRLLPLGSVWTLSLLLYVAGLFGDSYYGLLSLAPGLKAVYELGFRIFSYTRNGIFFAPVFLLLGASFYKGKDSKGPGERRLFGKLGGTGCTAAFLCGLLGMTAEGFVLRSLKFQRHDSMYVLLPLCAYFLYCLAAAPKLPSRKKYRKAAQWIYVLHPGMIVAVRGGAKLFGLTEILVENRIIHYLAVCLGSLGAALAAVFLEAALEKGLGKKQEPFVEEPNLRGRAWIEISGPALAWNVRSLTGALPEGTKLLPVLKADAYGHGALIVARELTELGIGAFCVACVSEAVELRLAGIQADILILGYTYPEDFVLLQKYHLIQTVTDEAFAERLEEAGRDAEPFRVHIALDTGMHRLGLPFDDLEGLKSIYRMKHLKVEGLFTHLCVSDEKTPEAAEYTALQEKRFFEAVKKLQGLGLPCGSLHLCASYGLANYASFGGDYARVGIALYGVWSKEDRALEGRFPLKPVLSFKARVAAVKVLEPGQSAGYGLSFTAERRTVLAVLAVGYGDGLPRSLSCGRGQVLFAGGRAKIAGKICMDQTLVDVTELPDVKAGDVAVLIGRLAGEEITACKLAEQAGTISNEILSRLGKRLPRIALQTQEGEKECRREL